MTTIQHIGLTVKFWFYFVLIVIASITVVATHLTGQIDPVYTYLWTFAALFSAWRFRKICYQLVAEIDE